MRDFEYNRAYNDAINDVLYSISTSENGNESLAGEIKALMR